MDKYILDAQGNPVVENDLLKWAAWFEDIDNRRVAWTDLPGGGYVSTVFLGLDHSWSGGPPVLWETMAFGVEDDHQRRYTSRAEAEAGHREVVALVRKSLAEAR